MDTPFLSIIIPAYNEEKRLPSTLEQVFLFLQAQSFSAEVLIVENGSQDHTLEIARDFSESHSHFRVLSENAPGKGQAVKQGMLEANGEFRFMCDADLSMPIVQLIKFLPPSIENFDIAIGSREASGASRFHEPLYRHLGGRAINTMIRATLLPGLNDTQCGFKCFRGPVATDLFRDQVMTGWSFDIEILYIARRRGYRIIEVPISWYFNPESKLSAFRDALRMGADILTIQRNYKNGSYDHP